MITESQINDQKGRRNSFTNLIHQANKLYGQTNKFAKIRIEDFD